MVSGSVYERSETLSRMRVVQARCVHLLPALQSLPKYSAYLYADIRTACGLRLR